MTRIYGSFFVSVPDGRVHAYAFRSCSLRVTQKAVRMWKKFFFNPFTGFASIVASQWAYLHFVGTPLAPFGLLGALSFSGAVAFVVCNVVASFMHRPDGTGGGVRVLARLVAALGGAIIGATAAAYAFGAGAVPLYAGMGAVACIAAVAMRALS